ncbi:tctex1 domain-containing protein 2 [Cephus cinctus]|uniref:Tctex1 domain-containing protein 2 n=1 Tax=Cephus cinctus TaxID=211228 RepID=A0AAJ7RCM8_CEPCN|nr:tctex1 domain-containing protein 2 [Cephus cinctus]
MEENKETESIQPHDENTLKSEVQNEVLESKKSDMNFDFLNPPGGEEPLAQPVYQIRPQLFEKFRPLSAKEVIHTVLFDYLSTKVYNVEEAEQWMKEIADLIKEKIKELKFGRYKYIVNVVLGEQHGAGLKMGTRCIWDAEADSYAYDNFVNDTIFCVATVYAVYFY